MQHRNLQVSATEAVRRAYRNVSISRRTIESRRKFAQLKTEELKNEEVRLDNRVSTAFQVLEVAKDLEEAESRLNRAIIDYRISLAELAAAMGSTSETLDWHGTKPKASARPSEVTPRR